MNKQDIDDFIATYKELEFLANKVGCYMARKNEQITGYSFELEYNGIYFTLYFAHHSEQKFFDLYELLHLSEKN